MYAEWERQFVFIPIVCVCVFCVVISFILDVRLVDALLLTTLLLVKTAPHRLYSATSLPFESVAVRFT